MEEIYTCLLIVKLTSNKTPNFVTKYDFDHAMGVF